MVSKVDEYMRKLADLDAREAEPEPMSTSEELERLRQLDALWDSMTAEETELCQRRLREKRVT